MADVKAIERKTYQGTEILVCRTRGLTSEAEMAARMIERWGCVAAESDGEDSAGRQKFKLTDSHDLVIRACNISEIMFKEFTERGWTIDVPLPTYKEKN